MSAPIILAGLRRSECLDLYLEALRGGDNEVQRWLCRNDLFFLLTQGCRRMDINRDWLFARCREVEAAPDGRLDLWAREHYKSTIITFGLTLRDILRDPEITVGIFSHTRPIAKSFLKQIKTELEQNRYLQGLFPDVLYQKPEAEAKQWSLDAGIIVKRQTNPAAATVEAWGVVDGQPIGKHFRLQVYDDVVTRESVNTPEQIRTTTAAWELSLALGAEGGVRRHIGTRYHFNDTWGEIIRRGSVVPRIHTATDNGKADGVPVLLSRETLAERRRDMGPYTFGCQMLQDPVADESAGFRDDWLWYYDEIRPEHWRAMNRYVVVDPAHAKKAGSDYTVVLVVALGGDGNYYLLDGVRDRLRLTERAAKVFEFVRKYRPMRVGYERYGLQADVEHLQYLQEQQNYRFNLVELGGGMAKEDRIRRLIPVFEQGRMRLPHRLLFRDSEGMVRDLVQEFRAEEYLSFPVSTHDDMLDCLARVLDDGLGARFPAAAVDPLDTRPQRTVSEYKIL